MPADHERIFDMAENLLADKREKAAQLRDELAQLAPARARTGDIVGALAAQHEAHKLTGEIDGYVTGLTQVRMIRREVLGDAS